MNLTGTTHISNSYIANSRSEPAPACGQGSAALDRTTPLSGPNVQGCNIGTTRVAYSGSFAATAARLPSVSVPSSSFNRSEPTDYLRPVSEIERLLRPRTSQPNIAPNISFNSMVNQLGSQYNSMSSSYRDLGFRRVVSQNFETSQYSQSNMPRIENNPMLSHMPLPSVNLSNGPFVSAGSWVLSAVFVRDASNFMLYSSDSAKCYFVDAVSTYSSGEL